MKANLRVRSANTMRVAAERGMITGRIDARFSGYAPICSRRIRRVIRGPAVGGAFTAF